MELNTTREGLDLVIEKARVEHPEAYAKTILYGNLLSRESLRRFHAHGLESFRISLGHEAHQRKASEIIRLAEPVLVVSTSLYWDIEHAHQQPTEFTWKGYKMTNASVDGRSAFMTFEKGSVRGLCAPISECRAFRSMPSLNALCLNCDRVVPFERSIECCCLSTVYCSEECKSQHDSVHANRCNEERAHAFSLVQRHRESGIWPFVVGFFERGVDAVPFEEAIKIPLVPTMLLDHSPFAAAKVLLLNNELVRQSNQDFDMHTARAEEAMATLLLEEEGEQTVQQARRSRRHRTKGRQTIKATTEAATTEETMAEIVETGEEVVPRSTTSNPPPEVMCPITHELMKDPVVICDGYTFERHAIENWFQRSWTNPMTGAPVGSVALIPNISVRIMCQSYRDAAKF